MASCRRALLSRPCELFITNAASNGRFRIQNPFVTLKAGRLGCSQATSPRAPRIPPSSFNQHTSPNSMQPIWLNLWTGVYLKSTVNKKNPTLKSDTYESCGCVDGGVKMTSPPPLDVLLCTLKTVILMRCRGEGSV